MISTKHRPTRLAAFSIAIVMATLIGVGTPPTAATGRAGVPRIVGGDEALPGAWPSQAALLFPLADDEWSQVCGGTVISPSWMLTAADCLAKDASGKIFDYQVLTGSTDLDADDGQQSAISQFVVNPGFNERYRHNDLALVRLDEATPAPPMRLIQPGEEALWPEGGSLTATGWGSTNNELGPWPSRLRQTTITRRSDAECSRLYPWDLQGRDFDPAKMICGGLLPAPSGDVCYGDGGNPLMAARPGGRWSLVGVTSFDYGCGQLNYPPIFMRVAAYTPWIAQVTRYGPFGSSSEFVDHQYLDILGRTPTAAEKLSLVARLDGGLTPEAAITELATGDASFNSIGAIVRFYYGYFAGRDPDTDGLLYWTDLYRSGVSLSTIAAVFSQSNEFRTMYGSLNDGQFVDLVYRNVLHRAPDAGGRAYWVSQLGAGVPRYAVMSLFTESPEHRAATRARVDRTVAYTDMLVQAPTKAWLDLTVGVPLVDLIRGLFASYDYASGF